MKRWFWVLFLIFIPSYALAACGGDPSCLQCTAKYEQNNVMATTVSLSFATLPSVGNQIKVTGMWDTVGSGGTDYRMVPTDNQSGNTYSQDGASPGTDGGFAVIVFIYSTKVVGSSGTFTVNFNVSSLGSQTDLTWQACEFTNQTEVIDRVGTATGTSNPTVVAASAANSKANSTVITVGYANEGTPSTGYFRTLDAHTLVSGEVSYKDVSSIETSSASYPNAATPQPMVLLLITYHATVDAIPCSGLSQPWSGIIDNCRAIDWTHAGVEGGIPTRTTICTTLTSSASAANIQTALNGCAANGVVLLGAGNYSLNEFLNIPNSVTLRGAGADQTFLNWMSVTGGSCNGPNAAICFLGDTIYFGSASVAPGGTNAAAWTAGYIKGATSITLATVGSTGISNDSFIYLDQENDTDVAAGLTDFQVCNAYHVGTTTCATEGGMEGRPVAFNKTRGQVQIVKVVSGCSSACTGSGPFTITISPALYTDWRSALNPGAWFAGMRHDSGIENLSINTNALVNSAEDYVAIQFDNAANCWVKGVRSIRNGRRDHLQLQNATHISIVDSYFFGGGSGSSTQYAIESLISSENLIQNNILQQTGPIIGGIRSGDVVSYNFTINQPSSPSNYNSAGIWEHDAEVLQTLYEGNIGPGFTADAVHGNSNLNTLFRNRLTGADAGKAQNRSAIQQWSYNRYHNYIGNVLGDPSLTLNYIADPGGSNTDLYIYAFGAGGTGPGGSVVVNDSLARTTSMLWGNYDTSNAANRFVSGEVPAGISVLPNAVPASMTLPSSFYLPSKPSWFGSHAWPGIGPDVTGGDGTVGGHSYPNPAQLCYTAMAGPSDGSGSVLSFNAANCYTTTTMAGVRRMWMHKR